MKRNQRLMQVVLVIFELVLFILYARLRILNARSIRARVCRLATRQIIY